MSWRDDVLSLVGVLLLLGGIAALGGDYWLHHHFDHLTVMVGTGAAAIGGTLVDRDRFLGAVTGVIGALGNLLTRKPSDPTEPRG